MDGLYQDRPNMRCRVKDPRTAESVHSLAPSEISRKGDAGTCGRPNRSKFLIEINGPPI